MKACAAPRRSIRRDATVRQHAGAAPKRTVSDPSEVPRSAHRISSYWDDRVEG